MLTYNFEKYLNDLYKGKLDPKKLYGNWDLDEKVFDVNNVLIKAFNKNKLDSIVDNIQPKTQTYKQLLKALEIINTFPDDEIKTIESVEKIVLNDTNSALINIKKRLRYWNDLTGRDSLTKIYDSKTFEAVKNSKKDMD